MAGREEILGGGDGESGGWPGVAEWLMRQGNQIRPAPFRNEPNARPST